MKTHVLGVHPEGQSYKMLSKSKVIQEAHTVHLFEKQVIMSLKTIGIHRNQGCP